ncbi:MAG: hypothetical protein JO264_18740 [Acidisphaera sp.]|nr:hypothetical protein [Acidisphaera sp.]
MFNSSVLDVAMGVVFGFLAVSLVTSAIVEGINSALKLRSASLFSGIKSLVNDPTFTGLAKSLYLHAAVNPRGSARSSAGALDAPLKNKPAYVDKLQFATALLDVTGLSAASAEDAAQAPGPAAVAALQAALEARLPGDTNPQIKQLLLGTVQRTQGDIGRVREEVAHWFDSAMDRVGGAFKRWTQLASLVIALAASMLLNVDSIHLAALLWAQPAVVEQLKLPEGVQPAAAPATAEDAAAARTARETAAADVARFLKTNLPVGWPQSHFLEVSANGQWFSLWSASAWSSGGAGWTLLPGWLVTAIATLFGAPFWFDVLQGVVRLKGAGPSPAEKETGRAAAT